MQRSGMAAEAVQAIMATQASREKRLAAADWVVANDVDDIGQLEREAQAIVLHM